MRTTLTIDPDVAARLEAEVRRLDASFKEVVNRALRRGLSIRGGPSPASRKYKVRAFDSAFRPQVDRSRLNQLADDLEIAAGARRLRR